MVRIRSTFVSNSSSTSFIVQLPEKCTLADLVDMGIDIDRVEDVAIVDTYCTTYTNLLDCWNKLRRSRVLSEEIDAEAFGILTTVFEEMDIVVETKSIAEGWSNIRLKR